jgi:hypothetical protein
MAIRSKSQLKTFFETGDFPTQEQFADLIDSLRHVSDALAVNSIEGLADVLNTFATTVQLNAAVKPPITGSVNVNTQLALTGGGILREIVFTAATTGGLTIRKNSDSATDFEIVVPEGGVVLHLLLMPVFEGATLDFISPTTTINYTIYRA